MAVAAAGDDFLVNARVKVGESVGEVERRSVDRDFTERPPP
jgi:hypothetical protein